MMKYPLRAVLLACAVAAAFLSRPSAAQTLPADPTPLAWPSPTATNRLSTRWWWMGNAVDEANITRQLEAFHTAGMGGVEICPIYGTYGAENRYVDFLSPKWMNLLAHTVRETKRLGMFTDMTTGTGWPFGGSMVPDADASKGIVLKNFDKLPEKKDLPAGALICAIAYPPNSAPANITEGLAKGSDFVPFPAGTRFTVAMQTGPQQKVKRPAPGAEGNVLDPYSVEDLNRYLAVFDKAFAAANLKDWPHGQFHDSFEYYQATWTPTFFDEFQKRRGYDLRPHLAELNNQGDKDTIARIKCDYRETLSDLHLEYMNRWVKWSHEHGGIGRNQAHGGPGNILDVYANADVPECEMFHVYEEGHMPMLKLAASGAHLTGKQLASAESFTWLDEHFNASLAEVKPCADFLFLNGVNQLFLHGVPYSPEDAAWPGWNFYASVNFGPYGGIWHDMPAFAAYVARCQSILQANKPYNDVLLYVPFHEFWSDTANNDKLMVQFTTPGTWMKPYGFYQTAMQLQNAGCQYDEVSDALLHKATVNTDGTVSLGGNSYKVLVVPNTPVMPVETFKQLIALANQGARIDFQGQLPNDVPGFGTLAARQAELKGMTNIPFVATNALPDAARVGKGQIFRMAGTFSLGTKEPMYESGLRCIRRLRADGVDYFVANTSTKTVDRVPLAVAAKSALIMDPRFDNRIGVAKFAATTPVNTLALHVEPGESYIIRTFSDRAIEGPAWKDLVPAGNPIPVTGTWNVSFTEGGPALPKPLTLSADAAGKIPSWTTADDPETKRFAGTAKYTLDFSSPPPTSISPAGGYRLDLGKIGDSARVTLNGKSLGTLWAAPFTIDLGDALKGGQNHLEIEVTNVASNRVRDMDQRGVQWKIFRDANILSTGYTQYDASKFPLRDAGLMGPVRLVPLAPQP